MPAVKAAGQRKRGPEDQGVREESRSSTETRSVPIFVAVPEATEMDDAPIPPNLKRKRAEQRRASIEVEDLVRATLTTYSSIEEFIQLPFSTSVDYPSNRTHMNFVRRNDQ